jgi:hypothetical protein
MIRLTETVGAAFLAVTGLVNAVTTPAMKQLKSRAPAIPLKLKPEPYHMAPLPSLGRSERKSVE